MYDAIVTFDRIGKSHQRDGVWGSRRMAAAPCSIHNMIAEHLVSAGIPQSLLLGKVVLVIFCSSKGNFKRIQPIIDRIQENFFGRPLAVVAFINSNLKITHPDFVPDLFPNEAIPLLKFYAKFDSFSREQPIFAWLSKRSRYGEESPMIQVNINRFVVESDGTTVRYFGIRSSWSEIVQCLLGSLDRAELSMGSHPSSSPSFNATEFDTVAENSIEFVSEFERHPPLEAPKRKSQEPPDIMQKK